MWHAWRWADRPIEIFNESCYHFSFQHYCCCCCRPTPALPLGRVRSSRFGFACQLNSLSMWLAKPPRQQGPCGWGILQNGLITALYVSMRVSFCLPHVVDVRVLIICRGLCTRDSLWMCVLYVSFGSRVRPKIFGCIPMGSDVLYILTPDWHCILQSLEWIEWREFCLVYYVGCYVLSRQ